MCLCHMFYYLALDKQRKSNKYTYTVRAKCFNLFVFLMHHLILKDAFWQIVGRVISAIAGFFILMLITPYLGPLRYGDYGTILAYFGFISSLSDLWLYVLGLRQLGDVVHPKIGEPDSGQISFLYSQVVWSRWLLIVIVYLVALALAYIIPSYSDNIYLVWGLPLGMIYSAGAMAAGIIQLPLQVYRKMEQVTFSLIGARISQVIVLAIALFWIYPTSAFPSGNLSIPVGAFLLVMLSVVISSGAQFLYTYLQAKSYIKLRRVPFVQFTWQTIKQHWQYGVGFFLSSAPMLAVILLLSWIYPTGAGFHYAGVRNLAMSLIMILLVIPPSIGNSLLHKVTNFPLPAKQRLFGSFLTIIWWIWWLIIANAIMFAPQVMHLIGGATYVSSPAVWSQISQRFTSQTQLGSDVLFVVLAFVLLLSFVKQVFTYLFVATWQQNKLFWINGIGVIVWFITGRYMISKWALVGWLLTQGLFEVLFVVGGLVLAKKTGTMPVVCRKELLSILCFFALVIRGGVYFFGIGAPADMKHLLIGGILGNALILGWWYKFLAKKAKGLVKN